eukprot:7819745-Lingulodinium_polyedra.AAC.1
MSATTINWRPTTRANGTAAARRLKRKRTVRGQMQMANSRSALVCLAVNSRMEITRCSRETRKMASLPAPLSGTGRFG